MDEMVDEVENDDVWMRKEWWPRGYCLKLWTERFWHFLGEMKYGRHRSYGLL